MKVQYDEKQDILTLVLNKKKIDDSRETENSILSVSKDGEPVLLEIFHATNFFLEESKVLPKNIKQRFFAAI